MVVHHLDRDLGQFFGAPAPLGVTKAQFKAGRDRRFGKANPEPDHDPFRLAMIRTGLPAYVAMREHGCTYDGDPIWSFDRFGRSDTVVGDRTVVTVAGEHEDGYHPDFMIYNDVVLWDLSGEIRLFEYPLEIFPPTDFHSATRIWEEDIWGHDISAMTGGLLAIIGNLGYPEDRRPGSTPVFALDLETLEIVPHECTGDPPGWISRHRATWQPGRRILVEGGQVWTAGGGLVPNEDSYVFDWGAARWSRLDPKHLRG